MTDQRRIGAIVMAGGRGVRMRSPKPKMLMPILGMPLVYFPTALAARAVRGPVVVVSGDSIDEISAEVARSLPDEELRFARQEKPLGTADAVKAGMTELDDVDHVVILNGDVPGTSDELMAKLVSRHFSRDLDLTVLAFRTETPHGYGRIVYDDSGVIECIKEQKELSEDEEELDLVNAGMYVARCSVLREFLKVVEPSPTQKEYLLTDFVAYVAQRTSKVGLVVTKELCEVSGVNNRLELSEALRQLRTLRNRKLMLAGVGMPQPESVDVDFGVEIGENTTLEAGVAIRGNSRVGAHCHVGRGVVIEDTTIADDVHILPYCMLESSQIADGCKIGPFAHTRPGTVLHTGAKLGNFVETKKTILGEGSKLNHLSYVGDAVIGKKVNVGAGTITCNYDGYNKFKTVLEDGVFIGSDTQLVAPVTVGKNALVAAGTTVTKDVPAEALVISRCEQVNKEGGAKRQRERALAEKNKKS